VPGGAQEEGIEMAQGQLAPVVRTVDWQLPVIRRTAVALGVALLALNVLDLLVTNVIIERFGGFEANPLMAPMIGTPSALFVKIGICVVVIALATRITGPRMVTGLRLAVAVYVIVATMNVGQIAYLAF
jgi:hypothetical protein